VNARRAPVVRNILVRPPLRTVMRRLASNDIHGAARLESASR
jgi:hypothetical protein